jgi:hypothetical protein
MEQHPVAWEALSGRRAYERGGRQLHENLVVVALLSSALKACEWSTGGDIGARVGNPLLSSVNAIAPLKTSARYSLVGETGAFRPVRPTNRMRDHGPKKFRAQFWDDLFSLCRSARTMVRVTLEMKPIRRVLRGWRDPDHLPGSAPHSFPMLIDWADDLKCR